MTFLATSIGDGRSHEEYNIVDYQMDVEYVSTGIPWRLGKVPAEPIEVEIRPNPTSRKKALRIEFKNAESL
jgi:hypothetical protein